MAELERTPEARATAAVNRRTVELSSFPDLVVVYLGMRVNAWTGLKTLLGFGPNIQASVDFKPEGLLRHERLLFSLFPPHVGMRQYWTSFDALEKWTRSEPHRSWWVGFLRDSGGTGFWHETYFMQGGMEAIYDDVGVELGFSSFAPVKPAVGRFFSARRRAGRAGDTPEAPLPEGDLT